MGLNGKLIKGLVILGSGSIMLVVMSATFRLSALFLDVSANEILVIFSTIVAFIGGGAFGYDQIQKHNIDRKDRDES